MKAIKVELFLFKKDYQAADSPNFHASYRVYTRAYSGS